MPRAPEPDPKGIPELPPGLIGSASPRAGLAYRLLRVLWRLLAACLGLRLRVDGLERLPRAADGRRAGGWIAAGLPHRSWIDPFVVWMSLPVEPRLIFFGDARTMARSPLRRWVVRRIGGIIPIPSAGGPQVFARNMDAATGAVRAGSVFCLFPESGFPVPVGTARPIAAGIGYLALRTTATIVPIVLGGNHELYLGRTIIVRVCPPIDPLALAGLSAAPDPGSREERAAAHRIAEVLRATTAASVAAAHTDAEPPPGTRKRGLVLTRLFR